MRRAVIMVAAGNSGNILLGVGTIVGAVLIVLVVNKLRGGSGRK